MKKKKIINKFLLSYSYLGLRYAKTKFDKKKKKLTGLDELQFVKNHYYSGFVNINIILNNYVSEKMYQYFLTNLIELMESEPKNPIFIKPFYNSKKYSYRNFKNIDKLHLANKMIKKQKYPKWGKWDMDDLIFKIFLHKNKISIIFNHSFLDGYRFYENIIQKIILAKETKFLKVKIPKFFFIPIKNELDLSKTVMQILKMKKNSLTSNDYMIRRKCKTIHCNFPFELIKKNKKKYNTSYNVTFMAFLLKSIFSTLSPKIKYLNIFVIIALKNTTQFNNYGGIILTIERNLDIENICENIKKKMLKNKNQVFSFFSLTNIYNLKKSNFFDKVDMVFSNLPASDGESYVCDKNTKMINANLNFPFTTIPIYCFGISYGNYQALSMNVQTKQIKKKNLLENLKKTFKTGSFILSKEILN